MHLWWIRISGALQKHQSAQNHTFTRPPARGGVLHEVSKRLNLRVGGVKTNGQQKERERDSERDERWGGWVGYCGLHWTPQICAFIFTLCVHRDTHTHTSSDAHTCTYKHTYFYWIYRCFKLHINDWRLLNIDAKKTSCNVMMSFPAGLVLHN